MKKLVVLLVGLFCLVYLFNPGAGIFELIPDNVPLIGNLDEAAAMAVLLLCLKYFGIELPDIFRRGSGAEKDIVAK